MSQSFLFGRYEPAFQGKRETLGSGKCFQKINRKEKKIRIQKNQYFLCANNEQAEREIRKTSTITFERQRNTEGETNQGGERPQ